MQLDKTTVYKSSTLIFLFLLSLPFILVYTIDEGLDPSWQIGLSLAIKNNFVFGKDFIFTYGPLGFMYAKTTFYISKYIILFFEMLLLSFNIIAIHKILKQSNYSKWAIFLAAVILIMAKSYNTVHLLMPLFLFFIFDNLIYHKKHSLYIALVISILALWVKVNYGIIIIFITYFFLIYHIIKKTYSYLFLFLTFFAHSIILIVTSIILKVDLWGYIYSSFHLIDGYNDSMLIPKSINSTSVIFALVIFEVFIICVLKKFKFYIHNLPELICIVCCSLYMFLLFKNGFVRADEHVYEFFKLSVVAFILMYYISGITTKKLWLYASILVLHISILLVFIEHQFGREYMRHKTIEFTGAYYLKEVFTDTSPKNLVWKPYIYNITEFKSSIGQATVDIIPWDVSEINKANLNYNPRPIVQSYSAYTKYLDSVNSAKYLSATAPDYVIYSHMSIDQRYANWDESILRRTLLTNYKVDTRFFTDKKCDFNEVYYLAQYPDVHDAVKQGVYKTGFEHYQMYGQKEQRMPCNENNNFLIFKKRKHPLTLKTISKKDVVLQLGQEYFLDSTNLQYMTINAQYNVYGKLRRMLFQPPLLNVEIKYYDSTVETYRAVLPILKSGILANIKINNVYDMKLFNESYGKKNAKIKSIKFIAEYGFLNEIKCINTTCIIQE